MFFHYYYYYLNIYIIIMINEKVLCLKNSQSTVKLKYVVYYAPWSERLDILVNLININIIN